MNAEILSSDGETLVEHWALREIQLNRLHDEIVTQREALLRSTELYQNAQFSRSCELLDTLNKTSGQRNAKLLQDIEDAQKSLNAEERSPTHDRFTILQANYWSMVKSILPIWEQELLDYKQRLKAKKAKQQQQQQR